MTFRKIHRVALGLAAALFAGGAQTSVTNFQFTLAGGDLDGTSWSGFYSYDEALLSGTADEYLGLSDFEFLFNGYTFTEGDDAEASVDFLDGVLLGLTYNASSLVPDQTISFSSGFFDLSEQSFIYNLAGVPQGGAGEPGNEIITTPVSDPVVPPVPPPAGSAPAPIPALAAPQLGILALLLAGLGLRHNRRREG
jgi:hypothetical protein